MAQTFSLRCYLCNATSQTTCKTTADFAGFLLAGFGGHKCKAGRELFHTPFEVVGSIGKLED